jgi:two-component system cell cycle sensor histidine kinase/response regulator CckA
MNVNQAPLRISLVYVALGMAWIAVSDWLLARLGPEFAVMGQTAKGVLFVFLSGTLIFVLIRRELWKRRAVEAEREELQSRLAGSQRLEAIGRLTGGIAHDFNNLLTAITGNLESYLGRRSGPGEQDPDLPDLAEAAAAARRAEDLTRQLLAFGRRQKLRPQPLVLNPVIEEMAQLLRRLIGDRIEIDIRLGTDLWLITMDQGPLQQVIMNLALNARDAMPGGGKLAFATANVEITPEMVAERFDFPIVPGEYVLLQVSDTGIGMDQETAAHIYEPFFTTKEKHVGTGLGMSTVYGVVKQSGGYITLESTPAVGTRFDLYFPRGEGGVDADIRSEAPTTDRIAGSETVLVVEDEPAVRSVIVRTLERHGFTVLERPDAPAALALLETRVEPPVELLLTDAIMPGMTGLELIERVREQQPDLPVLLISGYAETDLTFDEPYLAKPFTPRQLLTRVRGVLDDYSNGA